MDYYGRWGNEDISWLPLSCVLLLLYKWCYLANCNKPLPSHKALEGLQIAGEEGPKTFLSINGSKDKLKKKKKSTSQTTDFIGI